MTSDPPIDESAYYEAKQEWEFADTDHIHAGSEAWVRDFLRRYEGCKRSAHPTPDPSLTQYLDRIQAALEHYQHADDGAASFLKGFSAKADDVDRNSMARAALADLAIVRQQQAEQSKQNDSPCGVQEVPSANGIPDRQPIVVVTDAQEIAKHVAAALREETGEKPAETPYLGFAALSPEGKTAYRVGYEHGSADSAREIPVMGDAAREGAAVMIDARKGAPVASPATQQPDQYATECRTAFHAWVKSMGDYPPHLNGIYNDSDIHQQWTGWRAAWSARSPAGRCPITPESLTLHQDLFDMGREHERKTERESRPLTSDERHALIVEIIGAVDGLLAKDAVVSRDFLRYWQAYSGDIAKRILSSLLERFVITRRGSEHDE